MICLSKYFTDIRQWCTKKNYMKSKEIHSFLKYNKLKTFNNIVYSLLYDLINCILIIVYMN